jgi:hypothetical protein
VPPWQKKARFGGSGPGERRKPGNGVDLPLLFLCLLLCCHRLILLLYWKIGFRAAANILRPGASVSPYVVGPGHLVKQNFAARGSFHCAPRRKRASRAQDAGPCNRADECFFGRKQHLQREPESHKGLREPAGYADGACGRARCRDLRVATPMRPARARFACATEFSPVYCASHDEGLCQLVRL